MPKYSVQVYYRTKRQAVCLGMDIIAATAQEADDKAREKALKRYPARFYVASKVTDISAAGLIRSLKEMIDCYGSDDGGGPIPIIERAKKAIADAKAV